MGNATAVELLHNLWPLVQDIVTDDWDRERIYTVVVHELEEMDADTLDEIVYCPRCEPVDPILIKVLTDNNHLEDDWDDD